MDEQAESPAMVHESRPVEDGPRYWILFVAAVSGGGAGGTILPWLWFGRQPIAIGALMVMVIIGIVIGTFPGAFVGLLLRWFTEKRSMPAGSQVLSALVSFLFAFVLVGSLLTWLLPRVILGE